MRPTRRGAQPLPRRIAVAPMKLMVLQRTWGLANKGSASRARRELIETAGKLADRPHNQAEAIDRLVRRAGPVLREHGVAGLADLLRDL